MPVPKMKVSRSRRNKRSANKNITMHSVAECQTCRAPLMAHSICQACGYYKGRKCIRTKADRMNDRTQLKMAQYSAQKASAADSAVVSE